MTMKACISEKDGKVAGTPVDLVLSCVDNFEARMTINTVRERGRGEMGWGGVGRGGVRWAGVGWGGEG